MLAAPIDRRPFVPRKFIRENLSRLSEQGKKERDGKKEKSVYDINIIRSNYPMLPAPIDRRPLDPWKFIREKLCSQTFKGKFA